MRRVIIGLFSLVVLAILFVVLCTFVRRPYEIVLLNRFGKLIVYSDQTANTNPPIMYNWYFKLPTDKTIPIDTRLHLWQTPLQQVVTKGSEPISLRTFVAWRIVDPVKFYTTTSGSDDKATAIIERKIAGLVQAKVASHGLEELFNTDESKVHMAQMESSIATEATKGSQDPNVPASDRMAGVDVQGLEIVQVGFSRMAFPPSNAEAVYQRMSAERNKQAQAFRTEGEAMANQLRSEGDAEATKIRSAAVEKAEQIRGEADQEANRILAAVQSSQSARDFYQYWKKLDFAKNSLTKNTYIVLSTDTDWLNVVFSDPRNVQTFPTTAPATKKIPGPAARTSVEPQLPSLKVMDPIDPTKR
jgi:membrane protease subunit HflC